MRPFTSFVNQRCDRDAFSCAFVSPRTGRLVVKMNTVCEQSMIFLLAQRLLYTPLSHISRKPDSGKPSFSTSSSSTTFSWRSLADRCLSSGGACPAEADIRSHGMKSAHHRDQFRLKACHTRRM